MTYKNSVECPHMTGDSSCSICGALYSAKSLLEKVHKETGRSLMSDDGMSIFSTVKVLHIMTKKYARENGGVNDG